MCNEPMSNKHGAEIETERYVKISLIASLKANAVSRTARSRNQSSGFRSCESGGEKWRQRGLCILGTGIVANFSFIESYFQSFFLFRLGYDSRLNFLNREMLLKLPLLGSVIFVAHYFTVGKLIFMQPRDLHHVMVITHDLSQSGDMVRLRLIKFNHV